MKRAMPPSPFAIILLCAAALLTAAPPDYPIRPVPFTAVQLNDSFWAPRLETHRTVTIPFAFRQCEETGRLRNFEMAARRQGTFCTQYPFDDSDVFKIIEGAAYGLALRPDPALADTLDRLIATIAAAQEEDGYLYTARTIDPAHPHPWATPVRYGNEEFSHELYNVGHLYEAACAHFQATGKRTLLEVARKNANLLVRTFGPGGLRHVPGHQVIEIGLCKLFRVTGDGRYLRLARFFLDQRGQAAGHRLYGEYSQDHKPVREQEEAVGHAVRAAYMYAGMADVAALSGDPLTVTAIDRLWQDVVGRKLYLTGGIGAAGAWEGFGPGYDLPNETAYAETCAAVANVFWNQRMFLLHGEGKYIDVLERILYNGLLSGTGLSGDRFFYPNPLASFGQHERSPWFACACCPSNIARFIPSVPGYAYAMRGRDIWVNLYAGGRAEVGCGVGRVVIGQKTEYPWQGEIDISVDPPRSARFALRLRIPGWAQGRPLPTGLYRYLDPSGEGPRLRLNGRDVPLRIEKGYAVVDRTWRPGDRLHLSLPMPVRRVVADGRVAADAGRVAVERGPIVFCAEGADNDGRALNRVLPDGAPLQAGFRSDLLGGVMTLQGSASVALRKDGAVQTVPRKIVLIPYYAWAHRGKGEMAVWLARSAARARPAPEPNLAARSRVSASAGSGHFGANDGYEPANSSDGLVPHFTWWPKKGTAEWLQCDFPEAASVGGAAVYWFDDTGRGECRLPVSWRLLYRHGSEWRPVDHPGTWPLARDAWQAVRFAPVTTDGLRLEVQLAEGASAGVLEWRVEEARARPAIALPASDYPVRSVDFTRVRLEGGFWGPRLETNRLVTIPYALKMNEETGRVGNFRKAARMQAGPHEGKRYNDTDVFKALEAAACSLALRPDRELENRLDGLIQVITAAQEPDGYLYTARTVDPAHPADGAGAERWAHLSGSHELYNSGHLFEAAVAHYLATGKRNLLAVALKNADLLVKTFGPRGRRDAPGHPVVEMGLARLYRVTNRRDYLDLARFFLEQRGRRHDSRPYPAGSAFAIYNDRAHVQDHLPVGRQREAVGHAVRAMYLYAGMADVAALAGDKRCAEAADRLWRDVVARKMYLTGGVGARPQGEAFGSAWELPNETAYAETCAAVGQVFFNQRLFQLTGDAKYIDVLERALYNGVLSGVSLAGDRFFYPNPLESGGGYERSPWFEVSCCPANLARLLPSLPGYAYAVSGRALYVNLYASGSLEAEVSGGCLDLEQETLYPWSGKVRLAVRDAPLRPVAVHLRIPGWARNQPVPGGLYRYADGVQPGWAVKVNGQPVRARPEKGYVRLARTWREGDIIELDLPMEVRRAEADPRVKADRGNVALERGPLVYCLEEADNGARVRDLAIPPDAGFSTGFERDLLGGVTVVRGRARLDGREVSFTAIPYYAWANRGAGAMAVWLKGAH